MPSYTAKSTQEVLNTLYGSSYSTQYSEQEIANLQAGTGRTSRSWQEVLNTNAGNVPATKFSVQQCLFNNLSASLGLSGSYTQLSEQALLNMALNAGLTLGRVLGSSFANAGTLLDDYENSTSLVYSGTAGGSGVLDTTFKKTGSSSVKLTAPASGNYYATRTVSLSGLNTGAWGFWVYIPTIANVASVALYLSSSTTFATFFSKTYSGIHQGWNFIQLDQASFGNTGGESWSNTFVRARVRVNASAAGSGIAYFDTLSYGVSDRPRIVITFDDNWDSAYSEGYIYMQSKGFKGTQYIVSSYVDGVGRVTLANLQTMNTNGWDIANHTATHPNLSSLATQAAVEDEISICKSYLQTNGFTRALNYLAYPQGGYNNTVLAAAAAQGVLLATTVVSVPEPTVRGIGESLLVNRYSINNTETLAAVKGYVDLAVASGTTSIINFHKLVTSSVASTEWNIADFQALIDYIKTKTDANQLDVLTITQWRAAVLAGALS